MTTATLHRSAPSSEQVRQWRLDQLERAGYPLAEAYVLSGRSDVDLHLAVSLLDRGCPVKTALQILL